LRSSESGNFFLVDKSAIQLLKIKKGDFSEFEAYCSFAMDINCGKDWTISGYSKLWGWSRNKVRNFTQNLLSPRGHCKDTNRTVLGRPIHVIARENSGRVDTERTLRGQQVDTTIKTKTKTKKIPTSSSDEDNTFYVTKKKRKLKGDQLKSFLLFWDAFNYKSGKAEAADSWYDLQPINGLMPQIMAAAKKEAAARAEARRNGRTPKMGQGWLSGRRWEDETEKTEVSRF